MLTAGLPEAQEVFDTIVATMRANGKRINDSPNHYYDTELDGRVLKSAIGSLIPDTEYTPVIEGLSVFDLVVRSSSPLPTKTIDLLIKHLSLCIVIRATEMIVEPSGWEKQFESYADTHGLLYLPLTVEEEPTAVVETIQ